MVAPPINPPLQLLPLGRIRNRNQTHKRIAIYTARDIIMRPQAVKHIVIFWIAWLVVLQHVATALAQDVPGIEICTRESRLDRRTGCLQSNVEFLQQVIAKSALDAQQKLNAANRDIAALKEQLATANRDVAALKDALAAVQARIDQLQKAGPQTAPQANPDSRPPGK
jgi:chromosome segregation ATPase